MDEVVPEGVTLDVPEGVTLDVPEGVTLDAPAATGMGDVRRADDALPDVTNEEVVAGLVKAAQAPTPDFVRTADVPGPSVFADVGFTDLRVTPEGVSVDLPLPVGPELSDPHAGARAAYYQQQADEDRLVARQLADAYLKSNGGGDNRRAAIIKLATDTGLSPDLVEKDFDRLMVSWAESKADVRKWSAANPLKRQMLLERPEHADLVVNDVPLDKVTQAFNWLGDRFVEASIQEHLGGGELNSISEVVAPEMAAKKTANAEGAIANERTAAAKRDEPKATLQLDNAAARNATDWEIVKGRYAEQQRQLKISQLEWELFAVESHAVLGEAALKGVSTSMGLPSVAQNEDFPIVSAYLQPGAASDVVVGSRSALDLEEEIARLQSESVPLAYRESENMRVLTSGVSAASSTWETLKDAGVAGAAGYVVGAGGAALLGSPEGSHATGMTLARITGGAGMFYGSLRLEGGAMHGELRTMVKKDGTRLSQAEIAGGTIVYGTLAALVEQFSTRQLLRTMGPLGKALTEGTGRAAFKELMEDTGFRAIVTRIGKEWAKESVGEGGEEVVQSGLHDLTTYFLGREGPVFLPGKMQEFSGGAVGGAFLGLGGSTVHLATHVYARGQSVHNADVATSLLGLKDSPLTRAAPAYVAAKIEQHSAVLGEPLTHVYIDAAAVPRLFQQKSDSEQVGPTREDMEAHQSASEAMKELIGPSGPFQLDAALQAGGKLAIPLADYLEKWGTKPIAEALVNDTTVSAGDYSRNEMDGERLKADAQKMVDDYNAGAKTEDELVAWHEDLQKQFEHHYSAKDARFASSLWKSVVGSLSRMVGMEPAELFKDVNVSVAKDFEARAGMHTEALLQRAARLTPEQRAVERYTDQNTGLPNEEGFLLTPSDKPLFGVLSFEGPKFINDQQQKGQTKGGHNNANRVYQENAGVLHGLNPTAGKVGGDFAVRISSQEEMNEQLARLNQATGQNWAGAVAGNLKDAKKAHQTLTNQLVASKQRSNPRPQNPAAPHGPARPAARPTWMKEGAKVDELAPNAKPLDLAPNPDFVARVGKLKPAEYAREAYFERTGVLSKAGWNALPRLAAVAMFDLKGLRAINEAWDSEEPGNALLAKLAVVAKDIGGIRVEFAHLSGDEFAAQAESKEVLQAFIDELQRRLELEPVVLVEPETSEEVFKSVEFHHGIGDSEDEADLNLIERKSAAAESARIERERVRGMAEGAPQRQAGGVGGGVGDAGGGRSAERTGSAGTAEAQDVAAAQKYVDARRSPINKEEAAEWLTYSQRPGEHATSDEDYPQGVANQIKRDLADFGIWPHGISWEEEFARAHKPRVRKGQGTANNNALEAYRNEMRFPNASYAANSGSISAKKGLKQMPTPEESLAAIGALFVLTDALQESGAKPLSDTAIEKDLRAKEAAANPVEFEQMFRLGVGVAATPLNGVWRTLPAEKKAELLAKLPHVNWANEANYGEGLRLFSPDEDRGWGLGGKSHWQHVLREQHGDPLMAAMDIWLNGGTFVGEEQKFLDVLKLGGLADVHYVDRWERQDAINAAAVANQRKGGLNRDQVLDHELSTNAALAVATPEDALAEHGLPTRNVGGGADYINDAWILPANRLDLGPEQDPRAEYALIADDDGTFVINMRLGVDEVGNTVDETILHDENPGRALDRILKDPGPRVARIPAPKFGLSKDRKFLEDWLKKRQADPNRLFQKDQREQRLEQFARDTLAGKLVPRGELEKLKALFATDKKGTQGWTQVHKEGAQKLFKLFFTKDKNVSTLVHESAHVFLELFAQVAQREDAPAQLKADFAAALQWMGVEAPLVGQTWSVPEAAHEKWARGFELYLREGKAPVGGLVGAFTRFSLWLQDIYRNAKAFMEEHGVELNDEVRGVFNRLLAADEEMQAFNKRNTPVFASLEDGIKAGLSPEEAQKAMEVLAEENATTHAMLAALAVKDAKRETEAWWKDAEAVAREKAAVEFDALPAVMAKKYLTDLDRALDRTTVENAVGKKAGQKFRLAKDGGLEVEQIDDMAERHGFHTGADMLAAIAVLPEKDYWVKKKAQHAMEEAHPSVFSNRAALRLKVEQLSHRDSVKERLIEEWRRIRAQGPKGTRVRPPVEAIESAARQIVGGKNAAKLSLGEFRRAERKAAEATALSVAKGEYEQAAVFKQQHLLNFFLYQHASEAIGAREKTLELAKKLSSPKSNGRMGKASEVYQRGINWLLESFDFKKLKPGAEGAIANLSEVVKELEEDQTGPAFDVPALEAAHAKRGMTGWKSLSVDGLENLHDALANLDKAGQSRNAILKGAEQVDKEMAIEELFADAADVPVLPPGPSTRTATGPIDKGQAYYNSFAGSLIKPEFMLERLGPAWVKYLFEPLNKGKQNEADIVKRLMAPAIEALGKMLATGKMNEKVDGKKLLPNHHVRSERQIAAPTRRYELVMLALNLGNQSSIERTLGGRNITAVEARAAVDMLSKEEMDGVQEIWDLLDSVWPEIAALEQRVTGVAPQALKRVPLVTRHGTYAGGYFPAVYDARVSKAGRRQQLNKLAEGGTAKYGAIATSHSFTKGRVDGFVGPISFEPQALQAHLLEVAHDLAFREAVQSVSKLLIDERVQDAMESRLGEDTFKQFHQWAQDVANDRGAEAFERAGAFSRVARALKGNTIVAVMGYSLPTALGDLTNPLVAVVGTDLKAKHLAGAWAEMARNPLQSIANAHAKSAELRFRRGEVRRDLTRQLKGLSSNKVVRALSGIGDYAFSVFETTDKLTSTPVWIGAYNQAKAEKKSEADAVAFADGIIRKAFPSHHAVDLAPVLRDKSFIGFALMFHGYFNQIFNVEARLWNQARGKGVLAHAAVAGRMAGVLAVSMVLSEFFSGRGPEAGDEPEDEADPTLRALLKWRNWYFRKTLGGAMSLVPFGGDAAKGVESKLLGKKAQTNPRNVDVLSTSYAVGDAVWKAINEEDEDKTRKNIEAVVRAAAPLTGVPTSQPIRTGDYLWQLIEDGEDGNAADVASGLVYGKRKDQPLNPLNLFGTGL